MHDAAILTYVPDPFLAGGTRFCLMESDQTFRRIDPKDLVNVEVAVVTIQVDELLTEIRRVGATPPQTLIDIEDVRRLLTGLPNKENGRNHWSIWSALRRSELDHKSIKDFRKLFESRRRLSGTNDEDKLLFGFSKAMQATWHETLDLLVTEGEFERFLNVELPIRQLFNVRQYDGIRINRAALDNCFAAVRDQKYRAYAFVANKIEFGPSGLNFRNISEFLSGTDLAHLSAVREPARLEEQFKLAATYSNFAKEFLTLVRSDRDLNILSRLMSPDGRCFPVFDTIGTVTGRIVVKDPFLQGLRRTSRAAISSDSGYVLSYLDYDQFEPGILASFAGDLDLKRLYETNSLYNELARKMFGDASYREMAKRVFISYLYGMSEKRIATVLKPNGASDQSKHRLELEVSEFFRAFGRIAEFKERTVEELRKTNRVRTVCGGHRKRFYSGQLRDAEIRWSLSQKIQGTGSLIFKEALLSLGREFGPRSIVLPMHDAVLIQFRKGTVRTSKRRAMEIMIESMRKRCPNIAPRVSVERFAAA